MTWSTLVTSRRAVRASIIGLLLSVSLAGPAAQAQEQVLQVSIDEAILEQGLVVVTGTVTCFEPTPFTNLSVEVRQPVGRFKSVVGTVSEDHGACTPEELFSFEVPVAPNSGSFKPGNAFVIVNAFTCIASCFGESETETVKLKK